MKMKRAAAGAALALALAGSAGAQGLIYDADGRAIARVAPAIGTASGVEVEPGGLPWRVDFAGAGACGFVWHNGSVPSPFFMPLASEAEAGSLFAVIGQGTHPAAASTGCCSPGVETAPADAASPCGYSRMVNSGKACGNTTAWAKIACSLDPPPPGEETTPTPIGGGDGGETGGCYSTYLDVWFRIGTMGGAPALDTVQLECPQGMQAADGRAGWGPDLGQPGSNTNYFSSISKAYQVAAVACVPKPQGC